MKSATFDDFAENALFAEDGHFSYLQDDVNSFPALKNDFELPAMMSAKPLVRTKFWLSGKGLITPLHYDPVETFHWVIRGSKRFLLFFARHPPVLSIFLEKQGTLHQPGRSRRIRQ